MLRVNMYHQDFFHYEILNVLFLQYGINGEYYFCMFFANL